MIFPNIKAKETNKLELDSLKEIGWDFEKDKPLFKDNNFIVVEGIEALKVWIYKTIKTTRFKNDFKKEIIEALLINNYIESVSIIEYKLDYNKLFLSLKIETKINKTLNFEVSFNV